MKKTIAILVVIMLSACFFVLLRQNSSFVFAQLNNYKLIPQPEHYTELYFVTYPALAPSTVVKGKKINFSFEIHNVEGVSTDYPYLVYFKAPGESAALIDSGNMSIKPGDKELKTESYTMRKVTKTGNVVVYLESLDRYIYFSVPNKNLILDSAMAATSTTK